MEPLPGGPEGQSFGPKSRKTTDSETADRRTERQVFVAKFHHISNPTKGTHMPNVISKHVDLGNGKSVYVYVGDSTTPSPCSVVYYSDREKFIEGPDSELPAMLTAALQKVMKDEALCSGREDGAMNISVDALPGQSEVRVAVTKDYRIRVEQLVLTSCPGQPGYYEAPGYYRVTALALALVEVVKLVESHKSQLV